jgi:two-component system sensor histidine kinase YesM
MQHQLQDEVRRALTKYALVPVFIMAVLGTLLMVFSWEHYVTGRNEESLRLSAEVLTGILTDYQERADHVAQQLADSPLSVAQLRQAGPDRVALYGYLYHEVNITHDHTAFYLLDKDGAVVFGSRAALPGNLQAISPGWGWRRRLQENQDSAVWEFVSHQSDDGCMVHDLLIGRAICRQGQLEGYFLFVVPGQYLCQRVSSPYLDIVWQDKHDNVVLESGGSYADPFGKMALTVQGDSAQLTGSRGEEYYVTSQPLAEDSRLYAISPVTNLLTRYLLGAAILLAVVLIMVPVILCSVRRESLQRAQAVDELVAAFAAVKQGELTRRLPVKPDSNLSGVAAAYNHMAQSLQELMRENEAEARASVISEMRQLESQFNPHFLFNTLENIKFMVKLDPDAAVAMIMALSSLLRYSINNTVRETSLAADMAYTHNYIKIQQYRFGGRLQYEEDIAAAALDCLIPKLLFQPVLENAMRYGGSDDGNFHIRLTAAYGKHRLQVQVRDRGKGLAADTLAHLRQLLAEGGNDTAHTGVYNVHRRIQLMYGPAYGVSVSCPAEGGTCITMTMPGKKEGGGKLC